MAVDGYIAKNCGDFHLDESNDKKGIVLLIVNIKYILNIFKYRVSTTNGYQFYRIKDYSCISIQLEEEVVRKNLVLKINENLSMISF